MASVFTDPDVLAMPPEEKQLFFRSWLSNIAKDPDVARMSDGELDAFFGSIKLGLNEVGFTSPEAHGLANPIQAGIVGRREGAKKLDETVQFAANPLGIGGRNYGRQLTESVYQGMFQAGAPFIDLASRALGNEPMATDIGSAQETIPIGGLVGQLIGLYPAYALAGKATGALPGVGRLAQTLKGAGTFGSVAAAEQAGATGEVSPQNLILNSVLGAIEGGIGGPVKRAAAVVGVGAAAGMTPPEIGAQALFSLLGGQREFRPVIDTPDAQRLVQDTPTATVVSDGQAPNFVIPKTTAEGAPNPAANLASLIVERPAQTPPTVGPNLTEPGKLNSLENPPQTRIAELQQNLADQAQAFKDRATALHEAGLNTEEAIRRAETEFAPTPSGMAPTTASGLADALRRSIAKETLGEAEYALRNGQNAEPALKRAEAQVSGPAPVIASVQDTQRGFREMVREIGTEDELVKFKRDNPKLFGDEVNRTAWQEALDDLQMPAGPEPRLRKSATLTDLQNRAKKQGVGLTLTEHEGGIKFNLGGKDYTSLRAAQQAVESIERGIKDPAAVAALPANELDAVANAKGLEVVPVEDGKVIVRDIVNGVQVEAASRAEAATVVAKAPVMDAPDIGPGAPPPGIPTPQTQPPPHNYHNLINTADHPGWVGTVQRWVQVKKDLMAKVEETTGLPIYTEVWKPIEDARRKMLPWLSARREELNNIFKNNRSKATHQAVMEYVTSRDKASVVQAHKMTPGEVAVAKRYDAWVRNLLGEDYSPKIVDYILHDLMPNSRRGDWTFRSGIDAETANAPLGTLSDAVLSGELRLSERHAGEFGTTLIQQLGRARFMAKEFNKAGELLDAIPAKMQKGAQPLGPQRFPHPADVKAVEWAKVAKQVGHDYLEAVRNRPDAWAESVSAGIKTTLERVGLKDVKPDTIEFLANAFQSAYYGGALAFRGAQAARNLGQGLFPLVKAWDLPLFAKSLKESLTPETRNRLRADGLIGESTQFTATGGKFAGYYRQLQDTGMYLYRTSDDVTRSIAYTYGKNLIEKHAPAYLSKKISRTKFERLTGLEYDYTPVKSEVYRHLDNTPTPSVEAAARAYGRSMMEDTQWIYSGTQSPQVFTGTRGKLFGQFGIWPANFANAAAKMLWRGSAGSRARVLARYGALAGAVYGVEALTGYETGDVLGSNPLSWEGGPAFQVINHLRVMASSRNPRDRAVAYTKLKRMAQFFFPGGGLMRDIYDSTQEDGLKALLTAFGFKEAR